jgi:hypothetical protein
LLCSELDEDEEPLLARGRSTEDDWSPSTMVPECSESSSSSSSEPSSESSEADS